MHRLFSSDMTTLGSQRPVLSVNLAEAGDSFLKSRSGLLRHTGKPQTKQSMDVLATSTVGKAIRV